MKSNKILLCFSFLIFIAAVALSDEIKIEPIVVTASRVNQDNSQVLGSIESLPSGEQPAYKDTADLLWQAQSVDLQRRGESGVQSDLNIRGLNFNETTVLINGFNVSDPQTGHHNLDIPFTSSDIDRIEVLRGPASSLYGPNSGGVVNVITKKPLYTESELDMSAGSFNTWKSLLSWTGPYGKWSAEYKHSNGYRDDTDYNILTTSFEYPSLYGFDLSGGYANKAFGAYDFYTPGKGYPSYEWTKTYFLNARSDSDTFYPGVFWRRHDDRFMLDKNRPGWFENNSITNMYGTDLPVKLDLGNAGKAVVGAQATGDNIISNSLGNHDNLQTALYAEDMLSSGIWLADVSMRFDHNSSFGSQFDPSLGLGCKLNPEMRLHATIGRSFRTPSYTDLYYYDPVNAGNPNLQKENAWTAEIGDELKVGEIFNEQITGFYRDGHNVIDWVQSGAGWTAINHDVAMAGLEENISYNFTNDILAGVKYTHQNQTSDAAYTLKYGYLKNKLQVKLEHPFICGLTADWSTSYLKRTNQTGYNVTDLDLKTTIGSIELSAGVSNMFNTQYSEITGVIEPGRTFNGGMKVKF